MFVFLQKLVAFVSSRDPELGLKLYLECALIADKCESINLQYDIETGGCDFNAMSYEFMAQSFLLYEDKITDSKQQCRSITSIVGTLLAFTSFARVDYESLAMKATQYGAKVVKKSDQCKMIISCSHLFFRGKESVS